MDKKNVWNLHLLDKLYYINRQDKSIDDIPVFKLEIEDRDILINGLELSGNESSSTFVLNQHKEKMFFNKVDAEAELETWKFTLKTPIQ